MIIYSGEEDGAILIFLPGWEDICRLSRLLDDLSLSGRSGRSGRSGWSGWSGRSGRSIYDSSSNPNTTLL